MTQFVVDRGGVKSSTIFLQNNQDDFLTVINGRKAQTVPFKGLSILEINLSCKNSKMIVRLFSVETDKRKVEVAEDVHQ